MNRAVAAGGGAQLSDVSRPEAHADQASGLSGNMRLWSPGEDIGNDRPLAFIFGTAALTFLARRFWVLAGGQHRSV